MNWKNGMLAVFSGVVVACTLVVMMNQGVVRGAEQGDKGASPRYSVVETQAHNLLVTDNTANKLYFYTIEKDEKVGADLKLRATIDLTQVGSPLIKIKAVK